VSNKSVRRYSSAAALATLLAAGLLASPAPAIAATPVTQECLLAGGPGIKTCGGIQVEMTVFAQQRCTVFYCVVDKSFAMRTRRLDVPEFRVLEGHAMSVNPYACLQIPTSTRGAWTSWCTISTVSYPQYVGIYSKTLARY
jgi:hypothetical protein